MKDHPAPPGVPPPLRDLAASCCSARAATSNALPVAHTATADETFALTADWPAFAQSPSAKVDILFMVDDSSSMAPLQAQARRRTSPSS